MPRKKASKNSGAKAKAKGKSTAVSQNVKVSINRAPARYRLGGRPAYTMPSSGFGGGASVNVSIPHPLPSYDVQAGYSMHQLSTNVDNLVRYLQQQTTAQPMPGPSSEALARTAVMGTQTDSDMPRGASDDMRNLDLFANLRAPPVTRSAPSKSEGGTQTDPVPSIKPESVEKPPTVGATPQGGGDAWTQTWVPTSDSGTDPIVPASNTSATNTVKRVGVTSATQTDDAGVGASTSGPRTASAGTQTNLGQSSTANTDPLRQNPGGRYAQLPPRPAPMQIDRERKPASKRKSDSTQEGLTGSVGRPEYSQMPAQAPSGLGTRGHAFEGLTGRFPFVYPRQYKFDAAENVPMGGFDFSDGYSRPTLQRGPGLKRGSVNPVGLTGDVPRAEFNPWAVSSMAPGNVRPQAKTKRDPLAAQGGVQKIQRVGPRPRRGEAQILRNENELRAAMGR